MIARAILHLGKRCVVPQCTPRAVVCQMTLDGFPPRYCPSDIQWCDTGELVFRAMQTDKHMERARITPRVLACEVVADLDSDIFTLDWLAGGRFEWLLKINHVETVERIVKYLNREDITTADFDGPDSAA